MQQKLEALSKQIENLDRDSGFFKEVVKGLESNGMDKEARRYRRLAITILDVQSSLQIVHDILKELTGK